MTTSGEPTLAQRLGHWDRRSRGFDTLFDQSPQRRDVLDQIARFIGKTAGPTLDAGVGTGRALQRLLRASPDSPIIGTDLSMRMILETRKRVFVPIPLLQADNARMPFRSGAFSSAISTFTLHHIPPSNQGRTLQEIRRVLQPDGQFLLADQVKSQAIGQETIDIRDAFYPELTPEAVRSMLASYGEWPIDPSDLGQMLLRSGFRVERHVVSAVVATFHCRAARP